MSGCIVTFSAMGPDQSGDNNFVYLTASLPLDINISNVTPDYFMQQVNKSAKEYIKELKDRKLYYPPAYAYDYYIMILDIHRL